MFIGVGEGKSWSGWDGLWGLEEVMVAGVKAKLAVILFSVIGFAWAKGPPIESHPQRELILKYLQLLVDDQAKNEENHFFARSIDGHDWIFWREGRQLMPTVFETVVSDQEMSADQAWQLRIRYCRKPIDLDTGVVARKEDIGPSTYKVTRDFVSKVIYECVLNGELVVVKKKINKPR